MTRLLSSIFCLLFLFIISACDKSGNYEKPKSCDPDWIVNTSLTDIKLLYQEETTRIDEDWVVEAYIISSDQEGNIYGGIFIQDHPKTPSVGFEILVDLPDTYLLYPAGRPILIRMKGLYIGKSKGSFQLGSVYSFFEQQKVGRLPASLVEDHLQLTCDQSIMAVPKSISLENLQDEIANTFVEIDSVQFAEELVGQPYAEPEEETSRQLEDCYGNSIKMLNSGYADFASILIPAGSGRLSGVLTKDGDDFRLLISKLSDVRFTNDRCAYPEPLTSNTLFISEIADPENNNEARFIELYNAGSEELPLLGWTLERYTNDNLSIGSQIDLSGLSIEPQGTIIIASNAAVFETVFGFTPQLEGGKNSAADSNGDDNLVLRDPFGAVKDIFGRIGEDGSNTDHEFEDGRAERIPGINSGNSIYDPLEWVIYNDTGLEGTLNQPQLAPDDFTPGLHNR